MKKHISKEQILVMLIMFAMTGLSILAALLFPHTNLHSSKDFHLLLTERLSDAIDASIEGPITVSKAMAHDALIHDILKDEEKYSEEEIVGIMSSWLKTIKETGNFTSAFLVSEKTHRYYTADGLNKVLNPQNDSHDIWYTNFLTTKLPLCLDVDIDQMNNNRWTIFLNARIEDSEGNLLGVCGIGIIMTKLQELFEEYEKTYNVKINLVNYDGLVQVDTNNVNIENSYRSNQITTDKDSIIYTPLKKGFVTSCYINEMDWYLLIRNSDENHNDTHINPKFIICELDILLLAIFALFLVFNNSINQANKNKNEVMIDPLTGVYNRNYFKDVYGEHGIFNTTRYKSIAVFDIDSFKELNDTMDGDTILIKMIEIAKATLGNDNEIFRWGGDEFTILMVEPLNTAFEMCKTFCKEVDSKLKVTVSIGITEVQLSDTIKKNYYRAAQGCYFVKELGGNSVKRS